MTIIATAGDAGANSYVDVAGASGYFATRLYTDAWDGAADADKEKALMMATTLLDTNFKWRGNQSNPGVQALNWPRVNVYNPNASNYASTYNQYGVKIGNSSMLMLDATTIPPFLVKATCELALALLTDDRTADPGTSGIRSVQLGSMSLNVDRYTPRPIIPALVKTIVRPYIIDGASLSRA